METAAMGMKMIFVDESLCRALYQPKFILKAGFVAAFTLKFSIKTAHGQLPDLKRVYVFYSF